MRHGLFKVISLFLCGAALVLAAGCTSRSTGITSTPTGTISTTTGATSSQTTTPTITFNDPIGVVSVAQTSFINPGGPEIQITLSNASLQPVISLTAALDIPRAMPSMMPYLFTFPVSGSSPLLPGNTVTDKSVVIGGSYSSVQSYPMTVSGKFSDGTDFSFTLPVTISPPPVSPA
jgi:hypothetical protein